MKAGFLVLNLPMIFVTVGIFSLKVVEVSISGIDSLLMVEKINKEQLNRKRFKIYDFTFLGHFC